MNCTHILLAASILAAACCFVTGHVGPGLVTVVSLAAVYMYRYRSDITVMFGDAVSAASNTMAPKPKAVAEATGTKGVCKSLVSRKARNHRPGLPPPRDEKMLEVLPDSVVPSEPSGGIRRRQLGLFV